jgi:DNA-binding IclR family transcriptional regulator
MVAITRNPLSKALSIMRWMLDHDRDPFGVREVAAALEMTPSAAHRAITALVEEGFLRQMPEDSRYGLGLELFRLIQQAKDRFPLHRIAMPAMERLRDTCGEAVFLNLYDPHRQQIIGVAAAESTQPLRYVVVLQKWKSVHVGASGLAILAHLPETDRRDIYARTGLQAATDASISDAEQMEAELARIRSNGYALTRGQRISGAVGMAAPIRGPGGTIIGSVGISLPEPRFDGTFAERHAEILLATAREISELAGSPRTLSQDP